VRRGLVPARAAHRAILYAWLVILAALAVATIFAGRLGATPLFILLIGNAIWALAALERKDKRSQRAAVAAGEQHASAETVGPGT
jgi:hypothetical protein